MNNNNLFNDNIYLRVFQGFYYFHFLISSFCCITQLLYFIIYCFNIFVYIFINNILFFILVLRNLKLEFLKLVFISFSVSLFIYTNNFLICNDCSVTVSNNLNRIKLKETIFTSIFNKSMTEIATGEKQISPRPNLTIPGSNSESFITNYFNLVIIYTICFLRPSKNKNLRKTYLSFLIQCSFMLLLFAVTRRTHIQNYHLLRSIQNKDFFSIDSIRISNNIVNE